MAKDLRLLRYRIGYFSHETLRLDINSLEVCSARQSCNCYGGSRRSESYQNQKGERIR